MEKYKLDANEQFMERIINYTAENGIWIWPAVQEVYNVVGGKLKAETKSGYEKLKMSVSKKWFERNVVHNF